MSAEHMAKLQGLAQTTAATIRHASNNLQESIAQTKESEYGNKVAADVVSKGVPGIAKQLQEFAAQLWKKLILFLDSKGLKEPLERYYERFQELPIVQYIIKLFANLLALLFKSQFLKRLMGGSSTSASSDANVVSALDPPQSQQKPEETINTVKEQESAYTVMEALKKAATEDTPQIFQNGGTRNVGVTKPDEIIPEIPEAPESPSPTPKADAGILPPETGFPQPTEKAEQIPQAPMENGSPGPPIDNNEDEEVNT